MNSVYAALPPLPFPGLTWFTYFNIKKITSGSTVCAPSRSALMTGLHTGHTPIRGNREWKPEGQYPIAAETYTMAEMLIKAGYATGALGVSRISY